MCTYRIFGHRSEKFSLLCCSQTNKIMLPYSINGVETSTSDVDTGWFMKK